MVDGAGGDDTLTFAPTAANLVLDMVDPNNRPDIRNMETLDISGGGTNFMAFDAASVAAIIARVSAGSITSSISNSMAEFSARAFSCAAAVARRTTSSRSASSPMASNSLRRPRPAHLQPHRRDGRRCGRR